MSANNGLRVAPLSAFPVTGPIGVFDSGYGGLTILEQIRSHLPQLDYIYLGDNARSPYGTRSFEVVYEFTLEAVKTLFDMGCPLVILACNTASAKALRTIQQTYLPAAHPTRRVLGVIRPTVEQACLVTRSGHIGLLATPGTVLSASYPLEVGKLYPQLTVTSQACPLWVPLVENGEADSDGADYFVEKYIHLLLERDPLIDTLILGCTHYPLLLGKIMRYVPSGITVISQGGLVASSLCDYLARHRSMAARITQGGTCRFYTTESAEKFSASASLFLHTKVEAQTLRNKSL